METYRLAGFSTFKETVFKFGLSAAIFHWQGGSSRGEALKGGAIMAADAIISELARQISSWDLPVRMIRHSVFWGSLSLALGKESHEIFAAASIAAMGAPRKI